MSQDITLLPVKKIKAPNSKKGLASTVIDNLHDSISKEGLFNPIIVRPIPGSSDQYEIIQGRHRFYVIAKLMKEEVIMCRVFSDMTDEEAELAGLTENACRTHAKPNDRLLALRRWQEVYRKHFPMLEGRKASGSSRWSNSTKAEAKQAAIDAEKAQEEAEISSEGESNDHCGHYSSDNEAVEPEAKPVEHQTFRERVKAVTGVSDTTLSRDLKINEGLTEEQVYVLDVVQCTKMGMIKIIDVTPDDLVKRGEIVSLVASGMEVERAIAEVLGVTTTKDAAGRIKEVGDPANTDDKPLTDEEWFLKECSVMAGALSELDQYRSDAILYRQIMDERYKFRKKVKKIIEQYRESRKGKRVGWFYLTVFSFLNVAHPNDWLLCSNCKGSGMVDPGDECPQCRGSCYKIKSDRYV